MASADFHPVSAGFGEFKQTQNATVFLAKSQQTVVLHVKANAWNGTQIFLKKCSTMQWKY
jgi:hypothetical protein